MTTFVFKNLTNENECYNTIMAVYIWWNDVTVIYVHITRSMLCRNRVYRVKLSGEDLSHYSNNI